MLDTLVQADRDFARAILGPAPGDPTISQRAGNVIGPALGISPTAGKHVFHATLAAVVVTTITIVALKRPAKARKRSRSTRHTRRTSRKR